mgnify:FL=1
MVRCTASPRRRRSPASCSASPPRLWGGDVAHPLRLEERHYLRAYDVLLGEPGVELEPLPHVFGVSLYECLERHRHRPVGRGQELRLPRQSLVSGREPALHLVPTVSVDVAVIASDVPRTRFLIHVGRHQQASRLGGSVATVEMLAEILLAHLPLDGRVPLLLHLRVQHPDDAIGIGPADAQGAHDLFDPHDHRLRVLIRFSPVVRLTEQKYSVSRETNRTKMFSQDKLRTFLFSSIMDGNQLKEKR